MIALLTCREFSLLPRARTHTHTFRPQKPNHKDFRQSISILRSIKIIIENPVSVLFFFLFCFEIAQLSHEIPGRELSLIAFYRELRATSTQYYNWTICASSQTIMRHELARAQQQEVQLPLKGCCRLIKWRERESKRETLVGWRCGEFEKRSKMFGVFIDLHHVPTVERAARASHSAIAGLPVHGYHAKYMCACVPW